MASQSQWETFSDDEDDDALSLCDLPVRATLDDEEGSDHKKSSTALDEFEFRTCDNGALLKDPGIMCVADDIFHRGQLLPLRMSLSSRSCSSSSISRSQSSSSNSSTCDVIAPRLSVSNKFYAHPSPRPQVRTSVGSGRRSTGSAPTGWAAFRLGVVKAPEIEINDLRSRQLRSTEGKCEPNKVKVFVRKSKTRFGFGCTCTPDVLEPVAVSPASQPLIPRKEKEEKSRNVCKSSRMVEWLDELSIGKSGQQYWASTNDV